MEKLVYWSNLSMLFYILLGIYTIYVVYKAKSMPRAYNFFNVYVSLFIFILTFFATFRLVKYGVGGRDAPGFIKFFENCNYSYYLKNSWYLHQDLLFRYFGKMIRYFTSEYRVWFFIVYGLNVSAYILFLIEFCNKRTNYIPCLLLVFLYWRSFCTLRSNTAIAVFMISLVLLNRKKFRSAIIVSISSIFVHKMAFVYFLFYPFYYIYSKIKITKVRFILLFVAVISLISIVQALFLDFSEDVELNGAYHGYAQLSLHRSFWDNSWKIAFEQMLLGAFMWLNYRKIKYHILTLNKQESLCLNLIWAMCMFDMMTIPVNFTLGVWRGYEFFYLPRLVMWCEILYLYNRNNGRFLKYCCNSIFLVLFISWMVFRFYNMYEDYFLMPYIFEPFKYV